MNRRRVLQLSVRTLLAVVTICALWLGYCSHEAHKQKRFTRCIREVGGDIRYSSTECYASVPLPDFSSVTPKRSLELWERQGVCGWLPSWVDLDWVDSVSSVFLEGKQVPRRVLQCVGALRRVEYIDLTGAHFNADDLDLLTGLGEAKYLHLGGTRVNDSHLEILTSFTSLEELILSDTRITDVGLRSLVGLPNLKCLRVDGTCVTNAGMATLSECITIEQLDLSRTSVGDCGVRYLAKLTSLHALNLRATLVTEIGLNECRRALPSCQVDTAITSKNQRHVESISPAFAEASGSRSVVATADQVESARGKYRGCRPLCPKIMDWQSDCPAFPEWPEFPL